MINSVGDISFAYHWPARSESQVVLPHPQGWGAVVVAAHPPVRNLVHCRRRRQMKGGQATYTIDEALDTVGFGRFQWVLLLLSGIGFCATTVELISISLLRAPLMEYWPTVTNQRFAILASATFAGELLGGLLWGVISDRLGRRKAFLGTALMAGLFGLLGAFSPCFHAFALTRFFLGIAIGISRL